MELAILMRARRLVLLLPLLFCSCGPGGGGDERPDRPNIVIIVLDTVRAKSFSPLRDQHLLPNFHDIASRAIVFENASSTHDQTPPSHHSIFTGYYDGLGTQEFDRPELSMVSYLRDLGYLTVGVSANWLVHPKALSSCAHFDLYKSPNDSFESDPEAPSSEDRRKLARYQEIFGVDTSDSWVARHILFDTDRVVSDLDGLLPQEPEQPVFLFINLLDAHDPYLPEELAELTEGNVIREGFSPVLRRRGIPSWDALNLSEPKRKLWEQRLENAGCGTGGEDWRWMLTVDLEEEAIREHQRRYEAEIRSIDRKIAGLFDLLKRKGVYENSVIFITSDHGEEFGESGYITHCFDNKGDYSATRRVPMIVVPVNKNLQTPIIVHDEVSIADIKPTIDEMLGIDFRPRRGVGYGVSFVEYSEGQLASQRKRVVIDVSERGQAVERELRKDELQKRIRSMGYVQ